MADSSEVIEKLRAELEAIRGYEDPRRASTEWKHVFKLLSQTDLPPRRYNGVVGMRNVAGLEELIGEVAGGGSTGQAEPDADTLRKALHAFRKRARLTRLDDESKLGKSPLSKGADKSLGAISPPAEWPEEVWQALARQGKLRYLGHGMYELPDA